MEMVNALLKGNKMLKR